MLPMVVGMEPVMSLISSFRVSAYTHTQDELVLLPNNKTKAPIQASITTLVSLPNPVSNPSSEGMVPVKLFPPISRRSFGGRDEANCQ